MSQLDDALKQFRMSTAASRENLRNSRQNLDQMEEQVDFINRISCDEHLMFPGEGHDPEQARHPTPQPQEGDRGLQQTDELQPPGPQIIN